MIQLVANLVIGRSRDADASWLGDTLQSRGDIDRIARKVTVALLNNIAQMNPYAKIDPPIRGTPALRSSMPFCTSMAQRTASKLWIDSAPRDRGDILFPPTAFADSPTKPEFVTSRELPHRGLRH
jgi:hypothetical protein